MGTEHKICDRGPHGGDIEGQISFDGKWVAFARSLSGTPDGYGGNDYHSFDKWDVYIVRVDGALPATPKRVGHGYWPSWSDDSYNSTKTLYYSTHPEGAIRAVTVDGSGNLSNDRLIHNVKNHWSSGFEGFLTAAPNGQFCAARWSGSVHVAHWAGPLSGQKKRLNGGCHASMGAGSKWIFHANHKKGRYDGTQTGDLSGAGDYHYGSSPDMKWFVTRTQGDWQVQNDGFDVYLFSMNARETSVSIQRQVKLTSDGSWCDVHAGAPPSRDVKIEAFWAEPSSITAGSSTTLHWDVLNATSLTLNGQAVSGTGTTVSPDQTTTYTLVAQGENGPVSKQLTVTVSAPVLTTITVTPQSQTVSLGESATLTAAAVDQSGNPYQATIAWTADGGSVQPSSGATTQFSSSTAGTFTVTAASGDVTGTATVTVLDPNAIHIRINCGSNDLDVAGWERDDGYVSGGEDWTNPSTISTAGVTDAAPADVYQSVRHWGHSFDIPVPDGDYLLRMHFADAYGNRDMTYTAEGATILQSFDIVTEAGGANKALVKESSITVSDGNGLQIAATSSNGDVFESGLEVIGVGGTTEKTIEVAAAHTGQTYTVGQQVTIQWTATGGVNEVRLQITADDGENWLSITTDASVQREDPDWGAYPWTIPESLNGVNLTSDACRFQIMDYLDGTVSGMSGLFSIQSTATGAGRAVSVGRASPVVAWVGERLRIVVPSAGEHRVEVLKLDGRLVCERSGTGPAVYGVKSPGGAAVVRIRSEGEAETLRLVPRQ